MKFNNNKSRLENPMQHRGRQKEGDIHYSDGSLRRWLYVPHVTMITVYLPPSFSFILAIFAEIRHSNVYLLSVSPYTACGFSILDLLLLSLSMCVPEYKSKPLKQQDVPYLPKCHKAWFISNWWCLIAHHVGNRQPWISAIA